MATITIVNNGTSALVIRTAWNTNDTNINAEVIAATSAIASLGTDVTALENRFDKQTANIVANTDYTISNPFTLPIIPNIVEVRASDGTKIIGLYNNIDQTSGDIILNSGSNYTGAIITIIGW